MKRIKIFISSAIQELECEREVAHQVLQDLNVEPILFELFPALNQSPVEAYIDEVKNCDIFIMILWKSLPTPVLEEYNEAQKRSKPILIFTKYIIEEYNEKRDENLKDFLTNLTAPSHFHCRVYKNFRKISKLQKAIHESVINETAKFYKEPVHTLSKEEMYDLGSSIIQYAQKRVYCFQKTPSLLLGARGYLEPEKNKLPYEKKFFDSVEKWIKQNYQIVDKEFLYLFSLEATQKELVRNELLRQHEYIETLKERIEYFKNIEKQSGYRFRFRMIDIPISGPLIVGDNRYAIWLLGGNDAVSISQDNEKMSDVLIRMLRTHIYEDLNEDLTYSDFIKQLKI